MSTIRDRQIIGRIVAVQEDRFRLTGHSGRNFIFNLAHTCSTSIEDLQRFQASDTRLAVIYAGEPNMASGIAHKIVPLTTEF